MSKSGPMLLSLNRALRKSDTNPRDVGLVVLARAYAVELDDAAELHTASLQLIKDVVESGDATPRDILAIRDALRARQCVIDVGPKYLAALAALHLTTAARAAAKQPGEATGDQSDPAASALLNLAGRARVRNAAAVDAAAAAPDA